MPQAPGPQMITPLRANIRPVVGPASCGPIWPVMGLRAAVVSCTSNCRNCHGIRRASASRSNHVWRRHRPKLAGAGVLNTTCRTALATSARRRLAPRRGAGNPPARWLAPLARWSQTWAMRSLASKAGSSREMLSRCRTRGQSSAPRISSGQLRVPVSTKVEVATRRLRLAASAAETAAVPGGVRPGERTRPPARGGRSRHSLASPAGRRRPPEALATTPTTAPVASDDGSPDMPGCRRDVEGAALAVAGGGMRLGGSSLGGRIPAPRRAAQSAPRRRAGGHAPAPSPGRQRRSTSQAPHDSSGRRQQCRSPLLAGHHRSARPTCMGGACLSLPRHLKLRPPPT